MLWLGLGLGLGLGYGLGFGFGFGFGFGLRVTRTLALTLTLTSTLTRTLIRLGSVVRCYPDAGGRLPPSLRPPPTLPDACAPPAVLYDWFLTAGIYLLGT